MYQIQLDTETFKDLKDMVENSQTYYYEEWERLARDECRNLVEYEFTQGMLEDFSILVELFENAVQVHEENNT
jgi:hypothetical protein